MNKIYITIVVIIWLIMTVLLTFSIIGLFIYMREDSSCDDWQGEAGESTWFNIGRKLINNLIS